MVPGSEPTPYQIHDRQVTGEFQTDIPHAIAFEFEGHPRKSIDVEDNYCCQQFPDQFDDICSANHYFGSWFSVLDENPGPRDLCEFVADNTSFILASVPDGREYYIEEMCLPSFKNNYIESLLLCERPHWYNTGPHRVAMVFVHEGLRYAMAFEEGSGEYTDNLFVQALSKEGHNRLDRDQAIHLAAVAMQSLNVPINFNRHNFRVVIEESPYDIVWGAEQYIPLLLYGACTPSEYIDNL